MRILLDTCTFLWWMTSPDDVPQRALDVLRDPEHEVLLSVVTGWEIAIKRTLGRIEIPGTTSAFLTDAIASHDLVVLDVTMHHAVAAGELPLHHKDPPVRPPHDVDPCSRHRRSSSAVQLSSPPRSSSSDPQGLARGGLAGLKVEKRASGDAKDMRSRPPPLLA